MNCSKCKSSLYVKNGLIKGRQRYKCKDCGYNYTVAYKNGIEPYYKRLALMMYLEGLGFRSIGRIIGVSYVAVYNWIRQLGINAKDVVAKDKRSFREVEIDELHTYVGLKKTRKGSGWLLINWDANGYSTYVGVDDPIRGTDSGRR